MSDETKRGGVFDATVDHEAAVAIGKLSPAVWEYIQKRHEAEVIARLAASSAPLTMTTDQERSMRLNVGLPGPRGEPNPDTQDEGRCIGGGLEGPIYHVSWRQVVAEVDALRAQIAVLRSRCALDFDMLQRVNVARCESPDNGFNQKLDEWSILEWAGAMSGEAGEATNVAKKIRRKRIQRGDDKATVALLGEELADTICYATLTAARAGIDLGEAVVAKFNKVSKEIGSTFMLAGKKAA
jgi:NTP pyrophosphatase (non-canonical NTP hydrolase)